MVTPSTFAWVIRSMVLSFGNSSTCMTYARSLIIHVVDTIHTVPVKCFILDCSEIIIFNHALVMPMTISFAYLTAINNIRHYYKCTGIY